MPRTSTLLHIIAVNLALVILNVSGPPSPARANVVIEQTADLLSIANPDRFDNGDVYPRTKVFSILFDQATHPQAQPGEYQEDETVQGPVWGEWQITVQYSATGAGGPWVTAPPDTYTLLLKGVKRTFASASSPYDTLTTSLGASFLASGYWQISITRGVAYYEFPDGDPASRMAASSRTSSMARSATFRNNSTEYKWRGRSSVQFASFKVRNRSPCW